MLKTCRDSEEEGFMTPVNSEFKIHLKRQDPY